MLELEERVNHLDELMAQLIQTVDRTSREMRQSRERSEREMQEFREEMRQSRERSEREMQEFKVEMRQSRERSEREMQEFKAEMHQSRERSEQEMQEFKVEMRQSRERSEQEMQEFKVEMREFKAEMRQSKRDLDKKWGELSHKLGTMAEDLVAPSVPRILRQIVNCTEEVESISVRTIKKKPQNQEFDVIAVCGDYVLVNETKSTLRPEYMDNFYQLMTRIREYFPEFAEKQVIGAIASLYVDDSLVRYGEKLGLIVLGFGEELMDILNAPGFVPKVF